MSVRICDPRGNAATIAMVAIDEDVKKDGRSLCCCRMSTAQRKKRPSSDFGQEASVIVASILFKAQLLQKACGTQEVAERQR